jgi:type VI secretion system secreted protein Hcp
MDQPATGDVGGGSGAGKVKVHDITVSKYVDKSSPTLMLACCGGSHIKDGLITVRKAGGKPVEYVKIKLMDVFITSVQETGKGGELLTENVKINFAKFLVEYMEQDERGGSKPGGEMGWDIKQNHKM